MQRARERADGNLQNARKMLWKVTGTTGNENLELIADRGEVTEKVEKTLGLNFSQFRHAVLLAQGEFKAFLEAKEAERSQLLETITGTDIYSRLSRESHRRKTEAENRLRDLERAVAGIQILPDEERAQIEGELLAIRQREIELGTDRELLQKWLAWYEEGTRKAEALAKTQSEYEATQHSTLGQAADFAKLQDWEALEPIRIAWARMEDRERNLADAESHHGQLLVQREKQHEQLGQLTETEKTNKEELSSARASYEASRPALIEARRLDQQCEQAARLAAEATAKVALLSGKLETSMVALAQLERDVRNKQDAVYRDQQWMAQRDPIRPVLECHDAYGRRLKSLRGMQSDLETKSATLAELRQQESTCSQEWETASRDSAAARERLVTSRKQLDEAQEACRALGPATLRARDRWLLERTGLLEGAQRDQDDLTQQMDDLTGIDREIEDKTDRLHQAEVREPGVRNELQAARQEAGTLRQTLEKLHRALASDLAGMRAVLENDQPCPLCGSTQHPWAERTAMTELNKQLQAMQAQLERCEAAEERLADELRDQHALMTGFKAALEQLGGQRDQLLTKIQDKQAKLASIRQMIEDPLPFADLLEIIRLELESTGELLKTVEELEGRIAELQTKCNQECQNIEGLDTLQRTRERERDEFKSRGDVCQQLIDGLNGQRDDLARELREVFAARPVWVAALETDITRLEKDLRAEAENYQQTRQSLDDEVAALREMQTQYATDAASTKSLREQGDKAQEEQRQHSDELDAVRLKRAGLLDGESADAVEGLFNERTQQAETTLAALQSALMEVRKRLGELDGTLRQLDEQMVGIRHEWKQAQAEIERFCQREQMTLEKVEVTFAAGNEWIESTRRIREELTRTAENLKGQVETLRGQLDAHRSTLPPYPQEECMARMASLDEASERLRGDKENFLVHLGADDENRKRLGGAREQLKLAQNDAVVWQCLGEAIGSSDGKKFRTYAQGLTLRVLVEHANAHLRQLRPRFSLRQNENAAMDLVLIDHDLGGEVRPVRSLSGGESFLVSLALALGLSNMAARDLSIDSLFIDEGFGTLDADTLQMALAVLHGLHAQGKQVGIISHVEGIAQHLGAEVRVETIDPGHSRLNVRIAC